MGLPLCTQRELHQRSTQPTAASSSQKKLSLALDPIWGQNPISLETVNLKVGIKGKEGTEGWKKSQQSGLQAPGEKFRRGPKNPHHPEPRALFLWTASVLHYCARHTAVSQYECWS